MTLAPLITSTSRPGAWRSRSISPARSPVMREFSHRASVRVRETTTFSVASSQRPRSRVRGSVASSRVMPGHTE